jgi:hypothetical protein
VFIELTAGVSPTTSLQAVHDLRASGAEIISG